MADLTLRVIDNIPPSIEKEYIDFWHSLTWTIWWHFNLNLSKFKQRRQKSETYLGRHGARLLQRTFWNLHNIDKTHSQHTNISAHYDYTSRYKLIRAYFGNTWTLQLSILSSKMLQRCMPIWKFNQHYSK